jgi:hypothetical protein
VADERWVLSYEDDPQAGGRVTAGRPVPIGASVEIGREGELPIGVGDAAVSRIAASATATKTGWLVEVSNRNGAVLHPWGQAPELAQARNTIHWPLVALRLLPDVGTVRHWILLEADDLPVTPAGPMPARTVTTRTDRAPRPRPLTHGEREALHLVFDHLLSWPPRLASGPLLLKQAGRRVDKSISAVQFHLGNAQTKALELGLPHKGQVTDPGYLFVLVQAGLLEPPTDRAHRVSAAP